MALWDDEPDSVPPPRDPADRSDASVAAQRPRERLFAHGADALSDAELVALMLRTGRRDAGVVALASELLERHGGLPGLARSDPRELTYVQGVGRAKAATLLAALEIGRRISRRRLREGDAVRGPEDVFQHFHARLRHASQEHFCVLLLDGRHRILREEMVSLGTLTASLVHPREVFRPALRASAAALILVHNHPSGDPEPSPEDCSVTERLARAGELLGIPVLDHVVVAERGFRSLRDQGLLGAPRPAREPGAKAPAASGR